MEQPVKKRVAIIGIAGLPANYGGFETLVNYLTKEKKSDFRFTVYCQKTPRKSQLKQFNGSQLKYLPFKANGVQSIIYDIIAISASWFIYDTLIILGTPGCIILPFLTTFKKTRTIVNFGGLEWERNKWGKLGSWYLKLTEKTAIKYSTMIVADNQHFCNYIKKTYNKESVLIEYGGDHTSKIPIDSSLVIKYPFLKSNYDVSLSRAQPDNNLHLLLEAYSKIPERNLVLVSNYDKFEYGKELKRKYSNFPNLFLQDAIYDLYELDAIRSNAKFYIHSHSSCGTAPSLVEAMHISLPVIAFDVPTNHFTTEDEALYFKDVDNLINIINNLSKSTAIKIGQRMKEIANYRYTWEEISSKYAKVL
jgi:glycosyltransferase involved in cell wall biosynthesis